ncbi:MAG: penicillin-binding protein activator [Nitrospinaceae bacterium]
MFCLRRQKAGGVLLFFLSVLLTPGFPGADPLPPMDPATLSRPPLKDIFFEAEELFHAGEDARARLLFDQFLTARPDGPRVPKVLYRLGQLELRDKAYASALRMFQLLMNDFQDSPLAPDARYQAGLCLVGLERFEEAAAALRATVEHHPDELRRWEALMHLGRMDQARKDHGRALARMLQIFHEAPSTALQNQARTMIEEIIQTGLSVGELHELSRKLGRRYPADKMLSRLILQYRIERDLPRYQLALEDFIFRFPEDPLTATYRGWLKKLQENPKRILRVGAVLPLSGRRALVGQKVLQGIQLAFNQLSAAEKKRIELVVKDSGLGRSVEDVVRELAEDPNVISILGPILSDEVLKVTGVLERHRLPALSPTASAEDLPESSRYVFRNALTRKIQARFLAQYAVNERHLKRFVVFYPDETFGHELTDWFSREVEGYGGTIVAKVMYKRSQNDFKEEILEIGGVADDNLKRIIKRHLRRGTRPKALDDRGVFSRPSVGAGVYGDQKIEGLKVFLDLNYDAIFIPGFYDKVGLIAPQLVFYNIENIVLLGSNGWNSRQLVKAARNSRHSAVFVDGFFAGSTAPNVRRFFSRFVETFGEEPSSISAQAYDSANIMIKLMRQGAENRLDILDGLPEIKEFPGVSGRTTLLPSGDSEKELVKLRIKGFQIVQTN